MDTGEKNGSGSELASTSTQKALQGQLAFYLSDANLRHDRFLLSHVGPAGTGEVDVSVLASFKRVRALTNDEADVRTALRAIPSLKVSDDGARVARLDKLPPKAVSESRTIYVDPVPRDASIDSVRTLFAPCGDVAGVFLPRLRSRDVKGYAFVEFTTESAVAKAIARFHGALIGPTGAVKNADAKPGAPSEGSLSNMKESHANGGPEQGEEIIGEAKEVGVKEDGMKEDGMKEGGVKEGGVKEGGVKEGGVNGAGVPLRVISKEQWVEQRDEYKRLRRQGQGDEEASRNAAEAGEKRWAERAAADAATPHTVMLISKIGRSSSIKKIRREMNEMFEEIAPVEYVDYGVSNSGDPTVAYVRFKSEVGADKAVRALTERQQQFGGRVAHFELMVGVKLRDYLTKIGQIRRETARRRASKREQWWARKYGKKKDGVGADADDDGGDGGDADGDGGGDGDGDGDGDGGGGGGGGGGGEEESLTTASSEASKRAREPETTRSDGDGASCARTGTALAAGTSRFGETGDEARQSEKRAKFA